MPAASPTTDTDSPASIKERAAKKLHIQDTSNLSATYEWNLVRYALEDGQWYSSPAMLLPPLTRCSSPHSRHHTSSMTTLLLAISSDYLLIDDDYDIFKSRTANHPEVSIFLSGPSVPQAERQPLPGTRPHVFSPQMRSAIEGTAGGNSTSSYDSQSLYSTASRSPASKATSIHLIASSDTASSANDGDTATLGGKSFRSTKSTKTLEERAAASGVPVHKLAFDDFHNQVSFTSAHVTKEEGLLIDPFTLLSSAFAHSLDPSAPLRMSA